MPHRLTKGKPKVHWWNKLRTKYRLVVMNEDSFEEKLSFRLSRLNVFVAVSTVAILLVIATTFIIAFTPLREFIPGYTNVSLQKRVYELQLKADSLEKEFARKDLILANIRNIIEGKDIVDRLPEQKPDTVRSPDVNYTHSPEDSLLRKEFENREQFNLYYNDREELAGQTTPSRSLYFFCPLKGILTNPFDPEAGHFGVDIVAKRNEAVKSVLDGTVIFSSWTVETGYVIAVQHTGNFISVYKHNATLLKSQGAFVKAGDPIAIIGESGELTTGPHLHFELWSGGTPVNPVDYISF
jgi:murein DD-endopeptidase MepM/ murein hydrolase activator NlpD